MVTKLPTESHNVRDFRYMAFCNRAKTWKGLNLGTQALWSNKYWRMPQVSEHTHKARSCNMHTLMWTLKSALSYSRVHPDKNTPVGSEKTRGEMRWDHFVLKQFLSYCGISSGCTPLLTNIGRMFVWKQMLKSRVDVDGPKKLTSRS